MLRRCSQGICHSYDVQGVWYVFCFFHIMEMKDMNEFGSVVHYAMIGHPRRVLLALLSVFRPDWSPRHWVGVLLVICLPSFVLFICLRKVLVLCFVRLIRLQETMDYFRRHWEMGGGSELFLPWFWNEAGAGCLVLAELADSSLPFNFGINRIFFQFHYCTAP